VPCCISENVKAQASTKQVSAAVAKQTIVVIGNGMVGLKFCEKMIEYDTAGEFEIITFCEEKKPAYHRMNMTQYFEHRDASKLELAPLEWYEEAGVTLHVGERATAVDRETQVVRSSTGREIKYDYVVIATGSKAFVPPIPGVERPDGIESCKQPGVFVYRTLEDLDLMIEYAKKSKTAAVLGGGLLGLEAAKAAYDLGLKTHVVEAMSRLMPRQIDDDGNDILVKKIEDLGLTVHTNKGLSKLDFTDEGVLKGLSFSDETSLDVDMLIVSCGISPRDELARDCGLEVGPRGGVVVNDLCQSVTDPRVFAIGESCLHDHSLYGKIIYGLVAPGYTMADVIAKNLAGGSEVFPEADMSTKLKLMGVDVASFGNAFPDPADSISLMQKDAFEGLYKKLFFSKDGTRLIGGILVGDASEYAKLLSLSKSEEPLTVKPRDLIYGTMEEDENAELPDSFQVCQCNDVSKGDVVAEIKAANYEITLGALKKCSKAGTGCGGCEQLVSKILKQELEKAGKGVKTVLCEHFAFNRQELVHIVRSEQHTSFKTVLAQHGKGNGCEICKPAVASILASYRNDMVLDSSMATLQDSNDRFLANIQRGGSYSVIPRVPAGEILPDQLIKIGEVAKKYNLYTKITGGQRIDLFGAHRQDLPKIWGELGSVGLESGHGYAKALRTVKSCVGSTWCRYGVQDSVDFAVKIETRYKGVRSPHKMKSAVSGCIRECAEAQSKDFGYIATETGYTVFVGGNGGIKPEHAYLLATDCSEEYAIQLTDRYLMFYIRTADRLQRTAPWVRELPGGFEYLKDVIVHDKLGICESLEKEMQFLVDTYKCEWKEVVDSPELQKQFLDFQNVPDQQEDGIEFVSMRDQKRPANWPKGKFEESGIVGAYAGLDLSDASWVKVGREDDFPDDGGLTVLYGKSQLAVFHFTSRGEWYATQNMCPHRRAFVLARGIIGDAAGMPKVACPLHKKNFSLETGACTTDENEESILTFDVNVEDGNVYLKLPPEEILDALLATEKHAITSCTAEDVDGKTEEGQLISV